MATNVTVSPNIIRAWFDTVLNPLIRSLTGEATVLTHGNLTWKTEVQRFATLVPVLEHLVEEVQPNFEQFMALHPEFNGPVAEHDRCLASLAQSCCRLQQALIDSKDLRELLQSVPSLKESDMEVCMLLLAEYIINGAQKLPDYVTIAAIWNQNRDRFMAVVKTATVSPAWNATAQASAAFLSAVQQLRTNSRHSATHFRCRTEFRSSTTSPVYDLPRGFHVSERPIVIDAGPLNTYLVLQYLNGKGFSRAKRTEILQKIRGNSLDEPKQERFRDLMRHPTMTTAHVIAEALKFREMATLKGEEKEFRRHSLDILTGGTISEMPCPIRLMCGKPGISQLICDYGLADAGLIFLAYAENALVLTDDARLFRSLSVGHNYVIELLDKYLQLP